MKVLKLAGMLLAVQAAYSEDTVVGRKVVETGTRRIVFEQIQPPMPSETVVGVAEALAPSATPPALTLAQPLLLSCTVHQQEMTEVRWTSAEGEYVIWSSINFHHLAPLSEFEQDGVPWSLHFGLGNEPETTQPLVEFRDIPKPAGNHSWYQIVKSPSAPAPAAFAGVDALHRYFDMHREQLAAKCTEIENANTLRLQAQAQAESQALSAKPETVIRFWPLKSRRYGIQTATATGGPQGQ